MLRALSRALASWRIRRRLRSEISPEVFLHLTEEIRSLARCAAMSCPGEERIGSIASDLDRVADTVTSPAFARASLDTRLELRRGLIRSRQQLLDSLQQSARPTRFVQ